MDPRTEQRVRDQKAEDLRRLADKAEAEGVEIRLTADGQHFATSRSNPTRLHRVGRDRCDCEGFRRWHRCGHVALLLSQLGEISDAGEDELVALLWEGVDLDPDPEPPRPLMRQYLRPRPHAA